jgi:3-oxoadipate enol-lactonase / 4-carboxymuconolactone decarboxylase
MRLRWRTDGDDNAPPLVLLNSLGSSTAMWEPCVAPLAEQFRIVRIDTRGHGESLPSHDRSVSIADLASDVLDTMDELGLGRVDVAGLSLGGMVGIRLASHRPERVRRLALLCTAAHLPFGQNYTERAAEVRADGIGPIADAVVSRWITPALAERDRGLYERLRAMLVASDAESYAQCCDAIAGMDQRADLARVAAPTLVIGGADDEAIPTQYQRSLAEEIPQARLEILSPAAHLAPVEQPARVAALLREHFGGGATLAAGYATRREVLGTEHVDRAIAATTGFTAPFQEFLTRYAWGDVWSRPGLSRRERSIATLAVLVALGAENEIPLHVRAALRNGLTADEIGEVLLHTALYAGLPRANRAFALARDVLESD